MFQVFLPSYSGSNAQPGSIVFVIDATPYRVFRSNLACDSLMFFPAIGKKKSGFFAPKSTVHTPPKLLQSMAFNTEPLDFFDPLSSSPSLPPVLPDIDDSVMLTTPVPTCSVSCYAGSFAELEFSAFLRNHDAVESLGKALEDTRTEIGSQKATFACLEPAFDKEKQ